MDIDLRSVTVTDEQAGMRLDRFIAAIDPQISRTRAQTLIAEARILVHGHPAKPSLMLAAGDIVQLPATTATAPATLPQAEDIPLQIVYEDDYLLIVDKPAGMVVHPAPGHSGGTLVNALLAHTNSLSGEDPYRPGIVHRLDKDTSGLLLVAKDDVTLMTLGRMMRAHAITKAYLALIEGILEPPAGTIDAPIGRDPRHRQQMAIVTQGGREARTTYTTEQVIGKRTLVRAALVTGRTHQIRVHFAAIGHPVVGDTIYGRMQPPVPPRQFLHATRLALAHPQTGVPLDFTSPLPEDLASFLEVIER
jgi:23S rRNA pseudouridine1911/1915/1917 synthase